MRAAVRGTIAPPRAALALAAVVLAAAAWAQPTSWPAFPLEELRPGAVGYGLTEGPEGVTRFEVEVISLQEGFGLGFPLVLVRASGPVIDLGGGVSAGMSGSPVLLPREGADAILGAIGYVFPDAPGGLALVTPIEVMRGQALAAEARSDRPVEAAALHGPNGTERSAREPLVAPAATPVVIAGLGERALAFLQDRLLDRAATPLTALPGGGGGSAGGPLTAGSAIALAWVRGDVEAAVVGTVTEIVGDRLLAFGHGVLAAGSVDWPLLAAEVTAVVPHRRVPFRLANTGDTVLGRVDQDRPAGVGARLGAEPRMLPVTVSVALDDGETTTLRFEVVRDPQLWPTLVAVSMLEALDRVRERVGAGTATLHWEVGLRDGPDLLLTETVVDADDLALAAARLTGAPLLALAENPFQEPGVTRLSLLVRIEERRRDVEVRRVVADPAPPVAGDMVPLYLSLQPWRRAGEVRTVDVRWPADLTGSVEVVVRGATWPREPGVEDAIDPDDAPLTFDELLAFLRERPRGGDLVIEARKDGGSWRRLERLALPGFVTGRTTLTLEVAPAPDDDATPSEEGP